LTEDHSILIQISPSVSTFKRFGPLAFVVQFHIKTTIPSVQAQGRGFMRIHIKWFYVSIIVAMIGCNLNQESFQTSTPNTQETAPPAAGASEAQDKALEARSSGQKQCDACS
jgi:hypothetical protein